ncbi:hypothetical protein BABINDRAFT_164404 [Babjeviella inositovora NRRL Y-12698]|uniref:Cytoplasmic tRNA 2-thiolation protein 2 n=1 Tax=Babjeviella inositovora NRRL Y-12698 TaxID=984486 RepID=A0A1E3QZX5_9ASCO|nr:uncharacterized protein BABINDRAFT_164404 [Babjeviella inositovora NRRL Y-12698]ODQ82637.1 hypothetical protein BABINDRAFT_164404 [Babjeviella inositovora NRRL Y-12698]
MSDINGSCSRCKTEAAILISRKEKFCKTCFARFIGGKQRKQMQDEKFKVKYGKAENNVTRVLLALSFGVSSLALLDIILLMLKEQAGMHHGKQGFELVILNIDEHTTNSLTQSAREIVPLMKVRYPNLTFKVLSLSSFVNNQALLARISLYDDFSAIVKDFSAEDFRIADLLDRCPNKSSREDLLHIIYRELVLRTAYLENCGTVLYGHNMSRLANDVISLTVKGRGSLVAEALTDGEVSYRDRKIQIIHPLRDILQSEVDKYAELMTLGVFTLTSSIPVSTVTKNMTIGEITSAYFEMVESDYASVVSTVVKTADKLVPPTAGTTNTCRVCKAVIHHDPKSWLRNITVNTPSELTTDEERAVHAKYMAERVVEEKGSGEKADLCYGCIVTLGGITSAGFVWPMEKDSSEAILNDYILSDKED